MTARGTPPSAPAVDTGLEAVWREHWGRLLALLVSRYRRLDLAEDALAEAFEAAARHWPTDGAPANPPAWLLTTARRRVLDRLRAEAVHARKEPLLVVDQRLTQREQEQSADPGDAADPEIPDERLRLVLLCCHPAISLEASSALALRLVLGLPVTDIARLFLSHEPTVAARITRAKRKIAAAGMPFALPSAETLGERTDRVAEVAYLAFTAGYVPGPGADLHRVGLAGEAVRLLQVTRELAGSSAQVDLVLALMTFQHARRDARQDPGTGDLVLLPDQDRRRWRHDEISAAADLLAPWLSRPLAGRQQVRLLEAAIAAEHALAPTAADTRWDRIATAYAELEALTGSPVVRLNRAVAVAEAHGPAEGLELLEGLEARLTASHRPAAVRAELLSRRGDADAARAAYEEAIRMCPNDVERQDLQRRAARLSAGT
jgi:predicted RNA polymerase sigma factor